MAMRSLAYESNGRGYQKQDATAFTAIWIRLLCVTTVIPV